MFLANIGFFPRAFCVGPQRFFVIESIQSSMSEAPTSWLVYSGYRWVVEVGRGGGGGGG